jgi:serine/threonine protein kinase
MSLRAAFYTREYIEGEPLRPGPPPPGRDARAHLRPLFDLLDALAYLHAHDILHLDIHPGNLIEARDESRGSVLIDFGLLRPREGSSAYGPLDRGAGLPRSSPREGS